MDYYAILGVPRTSTDTEIKKEKSSKTIYFYKSDITSITEEEFNEYYY